MIDIGLNLASNQFKDVYLEIIKDAIKNNVSKFLLTGTDLISSSKVISLCKELNQDNIVSKVTSGIHPTHCDNLDENWYEKLKELYKDKDVISVGETGLDYFRDTNPDRKIQLKVFEKQVELSLELNKPLFLHLRSGTKHDILQDFKNIVSNSKISGVVHCYTGNRELLEYILSLDLYVGMTGYITESRGKHLKDLVKIIPHDKLLLETDAPYITPKNIKNLPRRNIPSNMIYILEYISDILGYTKENLDSMTTRNTLTLFPELGE